MVPTSHDAGDEEPIVLGMRIAPGDVCLALGGILKTNRFCAYEARADRTAAQTGRREQKGTDPPSDGW